MDHGGVMSLKMGIVGLPNVGKSTLFNALTKQKIEAANYPFCTIDPNIGQVIVPDPRLDRIQELVKSEVKIPATIEFVDIAGLVKGASQGEGLGNQFLSHIRQTDAILHVVRCFESDQIVHVAGSVNPLRDIDIINTELILSDFETTDKKLKAIEKTARTSTDQKVKIQFDLYSKLHQALGSGKLARGVEVTAEEEPFLRALHLITRKPVLYVCNVDDRSFKAGGNAFTKKVEDHALAEGSQSIMISSALEAELNDLSEEDRAIFLADLGVDEPGLFRLIRKSYETLNLSTFFTAGPKEARAWTILKGTKAPQAAGKIHTDFEKGFIRAEAYHFNELNELGSEAAVKEKGKYRSEGKDYTVQDGDVLFFRFNV
jgi:GTP-binding protein YchF